MNAVFDAYQGGGHFYMDSNPGDITFTSEQQAGTGNAGVSQNHDAINAERDARIAAINAEFDARVAADNAIIETANQDRAFNAF